MRARFFHLTMLASALGAAAACASSDELPSSAEASSPVDDGGSGAPDASTDAAASPDADATAPDAPDAPMCSSAGWCITELPDPGLDVRDVWPLEKHAFALAMDQYVGFKILEWGEDVSQQTGWKYIDDNTQQDLYPGDPGTIWAPNENEIYYTLHGSTRGGYLYHGKRTSPPGTEWTWTRTAFPCAHPLDTPAVWGVGGEVYALTCSKIYRLTGDPDADAGADGGASPWTLEYTDDDPTPIVFLGGGGTADDTLFVGSRGYLMPCGFIVRKTADGYQRVVDGSPVSTLSTSCKEKPGYPMVPGLIGFSTTRPGEVLGTLLFEEKLLKIAIDSEGQVSITAPSPPAPVARTVWSGSTDEVWLGGSYLAHGTGIWNDGGSYQVSTVALDDGRPVASFTKIRGTSNSNLWAVGTRAYHKTTP